MIHDLMLRWVVSGLFVPAAAECGLAVVTKRRPGLHWSPRPLDDDLDVAGEVLRPRKLVVASEVLCSGTEIAHAHHRTPA